MRSLQGHRPRAGEEAHDEGGVLGVWRDGTWPGRPYVIENVPEAPLVDPVVLCGSAFLLGTEDYQLRRHRAFETNWPLLVPSCAHDERPVISVAGHAGRAGRNMSGTTAERREAMRIPWLPSDALAEAIPPDYACRIGVHLLAHLDTLEVAA